MVTLKDIANEVGLNVSVVSRALNPRPDEHAVVAEETKRRISETAKKLGYQRNRAAEFLKRGKAATIGAFLPNSPNRLVADLMMGISEQAATHGFPLNFFFGSVMDDYRRFFMNVSDVNHSGMITYPVREMSESEMGGLIGDYQKRGGNIIVLNTEKKYAGIPTLAVDNHFGGRLAAERLLDAGCETFLADAVYGNRTDGFHSYLNEHGHDDVHLFNRDNFQDQLRSLEADERQPTGVFATSDELALKLYPLAQGLGHAIGKDVKIVGYDDLVLSDMVSPALTTIRQPFREEGRRAVGKLINMIYGEKENDEMIKPSIVRRESA